MATLKSVANNKSRQGRKRLTAGKDQIDDTLRLDVAYLNDREWLVEIPHEGQETEQHVIQILSHPFDLTRPEALVIQFVNEGGEPVNENGSTLDNIQLTESMRNQLTRRDGSETLDRHTIETVPGEVLVSLLREKMKVRDLTLDVKKDRDSQNGIWFVNAVYAQN